MSGLSETVQTTALPELTEDLEAARRDLSVWGYALIANALTAEQVRGCRERLRSQAAAEEAAGIGHFDNGELKLNQRVWNLVNKGKVFRDLLFHPGAAGAAPGVVGEGLHVVQLLPPTSPRRAGSRWGCTRTRATRRARCRSGWWSTRPGCWRTTRKRTAERGWCRAATCGRSCRRTSRRWKASPPPGRRGRW